MITHLTYRLAMEITSGARFSLQEFYQRGNENEYFMFTHYSFFYSHPMFGKKWPNNQDSQFHIVKIACHCCGLTPVRNYAGIGTMFLKKSRRPRRDFIVFCNSCKNWKNTEKFNPAIVRGQSIQLKLF